MSAADLTLVELVPAHPSREAALALIEVVSTRAAAAGAEVIESEVTGDGSRVFVVVEAPDGPGFAGTLRGTPIDGVTEITGPFPVRLVGAELEAIKANRPQAGYLVEWDLPEGLDMDTYLARKKEKSPRYAQVPEVAFLRTYVREDMAKCLCLYNAPDEAAVKRARGAVDTPFDRLFALSPSAVTLP
ncbi:MAG: DUF4242 domain-containing protein [Austwickia sp.]|nr:DUF4242 domain-containing protein [Austwickia sp.]